MGLERQNGHSIWGAKTSWLASRREPVARDFQGQRDPQNEILRMQNTFHDGLIICVFVCVSPLCLTRSSTPSCSASRHVHGSSPFCLPIYGSRFNRLQAMIPHRVSCLLDPADCCTPFETIAACQERGISASIPSASSPTRHGSAIRCPALACFSSPPQG
jgi:hypothetical protein